ncbi:TPA: hypothetical protein JZG45_002635 [Escherichia coli]|nr:hypothetical protein [Escherichia coli]
MTSSVEKFKTVITEIGAAKLAQAASQDGNPIRLTHMAVGDGGGTLHTPDSRQTSLVREVWRHTVNRIALDTTHPNRIIAELVIPPETGGFWIREIGVFDEHGDLIVVGNTAESYKPTVAEGSGRAQTFRTIMTITSAATVELTVDNTMVMASVDYVDNKLNEHEHSRNHPDATLDEKGFVQLTSDTDSDSETLAATAKAVKIAMDNASARLAKDRNGADIPNKPLFIQNLGLQETVERASNAVQKTGDTLSGGLTFETDSVLAWIRNTDWAKIGFKNNSDDDTDSYMWFHTGDNGNEYFKWRSTSGTTIKDLMNLKWDALYVLVNAVISGSLSVGTTKKFTWSSSNSSTKNATFNLWGNSSRPVVAELGDDSGWHFYSQRNTDDSITFAVNGQIAPGNWSNFDARYAKSSAIVSGVRLGSIASYTPGNETTWTKNLGNGNVLTGIIVQDTGKNSADNIGGIYYRPVQYCINGSWVAASSI